MWLTPCVRPISWASSSDAPFSGPFLKGQAAAGMKSASAFVSSGFCTGHPCRELATFRMASSLGHVAGPPLCSGKSTCTVDQHQGLLNGQTLEDACAEDARVCIACTVGVYGMDLRGGNVLALHCILWLAVPVATCSGPENHQAVQSQRKPTAEGFRLITSPVSGWRPGRFARIGPSSSFSDQIECTPLTTFSTFSSLSATIGPTSKSTGTPPPWRMRANPTRPRVLSL